MDLSICLVTLNSRLFLRDCLDSVIANTHRVAYEIIVVDNGSEDGTQQMLREGYPQVQLLQNRSNLGFSKPMNQAIAASCGDFLLALNPDTLIDEDSFSTQIDFLRLHPSAGVSIPKVLNPDGSFQARSRRGDSRPTAVFGHFLGLGKLFPQSHALNDYLMSWLPEDEVSEVKAVSGSCMFIRRECWREVGGFDEAFFAYQEDSDFCIRARANGWTVMYTPVSRVTHFGGRGGSKTQPIKTIYEWHRSYFLLYRKHYAREHFFLFNWFYYGLMVAKLILTLLWNGIKSLFGQ